MANIPVPARYRRLLRSATDQAGIPYEVGAEQITVESDFDPNAVSPTGAEGIAQFEPGTWAQYGYGSPFDPGQAFPAYGRYMENLMAGENDDLRKTLAAYNAGPGNLQAGYGYADKILAASGYTGKNPTPAPYANPLRDVQDLKPERVDMGVDYGGTGPIYALGPGEIVNTFNSGWPGGAFIAEKLSQGPLAGHYVYAAEDITPAVVVGQKVDSSTVIGDLTGGGIETGFAEPPGTGWALGRGQWDNTHSTAYGVAYNQVLTDLGAPGGQVNPPVKGEPPWWLKNVGKGLSGSAPPSGGGGLFGGIGDAISSLFSPITDIGSALHGIEEAVSWFTPGKILRTISFFLGSGLVIYGTIALARPRVNLPVAGSTPVVPAGELGPAFGIASVTGGAVLLFFAFHNTTATDLNSFLGVIRGRLHGEPVPVVSS